jgi:uroporphyrinogen III methyltransferase/synthase
MSAPGHVYLVGAGPWDAGLLTLRGRDLLARADVVVHDYLVNPELLEHARPDAERIAVGGGRAERLSQAEINALLVRLALAGRVVVRLKGGDPFVFGRGGEEAEALVQAGVPFEVVPGVTAAIACASYAGIPVTHRGFGSTLAFVTGHQRADGEAATEDVDWAALARMSTVVFYMGARNLEGLAKRLVDAGRAPETPVALVRWATRPDQRTAVATLADCAAVMDREGLEPPLTVIVGEVVGLRDRIGWYERKPLYGLRVVVTRSQGQQGPLAGRLRELGAEVLSLPTIRFEPPADPAPLRAAIARLDTYDWVLVTSANTVDFFLDALWASGRDARAFGRARLGCIGPATARRLQERGLRPDVVPEAFVAEGLLDALRAEGLAGRRVLIPRAEVAREVLPETLSAMGAEVDVVPVYRTVPAEVDPAVLARIAGGDVDVVTFTSASTVRHFCVGFSDEELARIRGRARAACIGPVTEQAARAAGFEVAVSAATYTIPGLVDALVGWREEIAKNGR